MMNDSDDDFDNSSVMGKLTISEGSYNPDQSYTSSYQISSPTPIRDENIVYVEFHKGYIFRTLIEFLKGIKSNANLVFTPKQLLFTEVNDMKDVLYHWEIDTYKLPKYKYDFRGTDGKLEESMYVGISLKTFASVCKNVGKNESFKMYVKRGKNFLYYSRTGRSSSSNSEDYVVIEKSDIVIHTGLDTAITRSKDDPNVTIPCSELTDLCNDIHTMKANKLTFRAYNKGLQIIAKVDGDISQKNPKYGDCSGVSVKNGKMCISKPIEGSIRVELFKDMRKLHNLCHDGGSVRFYIQRITEDLIIVKLTTDVGYFGELTQYIKAVPINAKQD